VTKATVVVIVLRAAGAPTVSVRVPEVLALIVHVRTPLASVLTEVPHVVVLPVAFTVTDAVVATPAITTLFASRTVRVQVEFVTPFAFTLLEAEHVKVEYVSEGV
jgi:hypothetical protein